MVAVTVSTEKEGEEKKIVYSLSLEISKFFGISGLTV